MLLQIQGTSWFRGDLFKSAPAWKSLYTMYLFRYGRSKQLRYQVSLIAAPPCKPGMMSNVEASEGSTSMYVGASAAPTLVCSVLSDVHNAGIQFNSLFSLHSEADTCQHDI